MFIGELFRLEFFLIPQGYLSGSTSNLTIALVNHSVDSNSSVSSNKWSSTASVYNFFITCIKNSS